jgi:uncharacterized membrane protein YgaE (UPF0421/DUF939 family)
MDRSIVIEQVKSRCATKAATRYYLKCILGFSTLYLFYRAFPELPMIWSIISTIMVLAPEDHATNGLARSRVLANIIGGFVGLVCFIFLGNSIAVICLAMVVTIAICSYIQLGVGTRTALVALIIVMLNQLETDSWQIAFERVLLVMLGCGVAMLSDYIVDRLFKQSEPQLKNMCSPNQK